MSCCGFFKKNSNEEEGLLSKTDSGYTWEQLFNRFKVVAGSGSFSTTIAILCDQNLLNSLDDTTRDVVTVIIAGTTFALVTSLAWRYSPCMLSERK